MSNSGEMFLNYVEFLFSVNMVGSEKYKYSGK